MATPDELVIDLDDIDHVLVGTTRSPGTCKLTGFDDANKWDIKDAGSQEGASSSYKGKGIRKGSISFYIVDDGGSGTNDFEEWDSFQRLLESTLNGATPTALPIYHPDLARKRFTEFVLGEAGVSLPVYDGRGGATYTADIQEYKPPKPKPAKKAVPKPAAPTRTYANTDEGPRSPPPPEDPNAAAKRELAALTDEASAP